MITTAIYGALWQSKYMQQINKETFWYGKCPNINHIAHMHRVVPVPKNCQYTGIDTPRPFSRYLNSANTGTHFIT